MALLDFLKRKKEVQKAKGGKPGKVLDTKKTEEQIRVNPPLNPRKSASTNRFSYQVVKAPHISEKANYLAEDNKYVFKVYPNTNKLEIKKSVEGIYKVDVLSVNIIKIPGKKRRMGGIEGFKKGHTKAVVTIKEGQKIEIY